MARSDLRVRSSYDKEGETFVGSFRPAHTGRPDRIVIVVDGSRTMKPHFAEMGAAIAMLTKNVDVQVMLAADELIDLSEYAVDTDQLVHQLKIHASPGGCDNMAALVDAWDIADRTTEILWIHGPQPISQEDNIAFAQRVDNAKFAPAIWDMQIVAGPNRAFEGVKDRLDVQRVNFSGELASNLDEWWQALQLPSWSVEWRLAKSAKASSREVSLDSVVALCQPKVKDLWAWQRVRSLLNIRGRTGESYYTIRDEATNLAAEHHIVTPVSGAVVLETQAQYERNGLTPVDQVHNKNVSTPEPSSQLLTLFAIWPVIHLLRRRRRDAWRATN